MPFTIIAAPLIIKENKILLIKNAKEEKKGYWQLPGGKVELGEKPEGAVVREVKEETGLNFNNPKFFTYFEHYFQDAKQHYFYLVFKGDVLGSIEQINERIKINPREVLEFGWFTKLQLKTMNIRQGTRIITDRLM